MWTYVRGDDGQGVEEQHLLRWQGRPVCALKPRGGSNWHASLLDLSCISAKGISLWNKPLDTAKVLCEEELRRMGWDRDFGSAGSAPRSSEK